MIGENNMRTMYLQATVAWHRRLLELHEEKNAIAAAYRHAVFSRDVYRELDGEIDTQIADNNQYIKDGLERLDALDCSPDEYQLMQCQCGKVGCTDRILVKRSGL
jgi:hypothetical protein